MGIKYLQLNFKIATSHYICGNEPTHVVNFVTISEDFNLTQTVLNLLQLITNTRSIAFQKFLLQTSRPIK